MRGIRATARPVPHECAEWFMPDRRFTAYAWREFFAMFVCTNCTMSLRIGAVNTAGSGHVPTTESDDAEYTLTDGRADIATGACFRV
ncbi:hypothetical protein IOCL2690_000037300 [Leishmania lindenbergi]|uniref:Uncharacterized protein n=1 Tax=Leishmania lindenbergi TaxID=651832 RepID=A0AAW3AYD2_9TRYP